MYQRRSPDYTSLVIAAKDRYPAEWEAARERPDGSRDDRFIRLLAWDASKVDANIGMNGKRGSDVISTDALAYRNPTAPGGAEVIDVIVGATHQPSWQDATVPPVPEPGSLPHVPEGVLGKYIAPKDPGGSQPTPPPPGEPPNTSDILKRIGELEQRLKEIEAKTLAAALDANEARQMGIILSERIAGLKLKAAPELPDDQAISTNSVWGHAHRLKARIVS